MFKHDEIITENLWKPKKESFLKKWMNRTPEDTRSLPTVIIHTVTFFIMTVLSLAGNLFVCFAFYGNRRLRTITNFFVFSLPITDIISATFEYSFNTVAFGLRKWPFCVNFCQFHGFFAFYWDVVTMSILALTIVNRYFCVVKPRFYSSFFTKRKTVFLILFVLLFFFHWQWNRILQHLQLQ